MHRMGSYFDPAGSSASLAGSMTSLQTMPPTATPPIKATPPLKGILSVPASYHTPPTPPPTSSIPKPPFNKRKPPPMSPTAHGSDPPQSLQPTVQRRLADYSMNPMSNASKLHTGNRPVDRIKRNIQRLRYEDQDMKQITALNKRLASLTIADMSPRLVHQRILLLFEKGDHREAAAFIRRVSQPTYRQIVNELPIDLFIDSMPHSMPILEAIYAKLYLASTNGTLTMSGKLTGNFSPESVVWQIVRFFACHEDGGMGGGSRLEMCGPWVSTCKRLLSVLLSAEPRIRRVVAERRKALTKAIEGLGQHGMVGTSDESLMNLHDALRHQFHHVQKSYADALGKLDAMSLVQRSKNVAKEPPIAQSHQRQLSLKVEEIQERLIKNKTLLNVMEPTLENHSLEVLLGILQRRIELDKEVLFQFTQLKRDKKLLSGAGSLRNPMVAPVLMKYQKGCQQVRSWLSYLNPLFFFYGEDGEIGLL